MTMKEAFATVLELAEENALSADQETEELREQARKQEEAIRIVNQALEKVTSLAKQFDLDRN